MDWKICRQTSLDKLFQGKSKLKLPIAGGVLGAGRLLLFLGVGLISVVALTIYFLIAMQGVKKLWLSLIPRSRRERTGLLTDEVFNRVGGFHAWKPFELADSRNRNLRMAPDLGRSLCTTTWNISSLFDLIPMVGSTIAGVAVSLVALTKGLPVALATGAFYIVYRFLEDYLVNPRVMKHTVKVTPGLTTLATLIGGTLLGLLGTLVSIPVATTIHLLLEEVVIPRQNRH